MTTCSRCETDVTGPSVETYSAVRWVPVEDDVDGGYSELVAIYCTPCWFGVAPYRSPG